MLKATGRMRARAFVQASASNTRAKKPHRLRNSLLMALMALGVLGVGAAPASAAVVNVTLAGAGTGTVTSEPPGVNCSNTPGHEQTDCNVDLGVTVYQVKLFASADSSFVFRNWSSGNAGGTCASGSENPCLTTFLFAPGDVTATFGPPPDPPTAATDVASAVGPYAATLQGRVNPGGNEVTGCYFEIGRTTNYGQKVNCRPSDLGDGRSDIAVNAGSGTLKPETTYHYRLVAENVGGNEIGDDRTFTTPAALQDLCPNAAVRAEQGAQAVEHCVAYEMVSPSQKYSRNTGATDLDPSADAVLMGSGGGFAGSPTVTGLFNSYLGTRIRDGWTTIPLNLPAEFERPSVPKDNLPDLSRVLMLSGTYAESDDDTYRFYFSDSDGTNRPASPPLKHLGGTGTVGGFVEYDAASSDLSRFVFSTENTKILSGYDPVGSALTSKNIYEVVGAGTDQMSIRRVDLDNGGVVVGPLCANRGPGGQNTSRLARGTNLMSADGRVIFFSAFSQAAPTAGCTASARGRLRVLARIDGARTVEVSQSQCTRAADPGAVPPVAACNAAADTLFEGASSDGETVYFSTTQQLTNDDTNTVSDLYEYQFGNEFSTGSLRRATTAIDGAPDATANLRGVLAMSAERDQPYRVYFVAAGRITTNSNERGEQPTANGNNLYLYERSADGESSRIVFISTLGSGDSGLWGMFGRTADVADNGRVLIFPSQARLTPDDTDGATDLYRYDAISGALIRVSTSEPGWDGGNANSQVIGAYTPFGVDNRVGIGLRASSSDGSVVVFGTQEPLSPRDINGMTDVYQWRNGVVSLVTDGQGPESGIVSGKREFGVSQSGNAIVFSTHQRLLSADGDGARDTYIARIDGGFSELATDHAQCKGEGCQGPEPSPPALPSVGSVIFGGDGNVPSVSDRVRASIRVSKLRAVTGSAATFKVSVPDAGRIVLRGHLVRRTGRSAKKAGSYRLRIALRPGARKLLWKRGALRVSAGVAYRAADGQAASEAIKVTFKKTRSKQAKGKKKGGRR